MAWLSVTSLLLQWAWGQLLCSPCWKGLGLSNPHVELPEPSCTQTAPDTASSGINIHWPHTSHEPRTSSTAMPTSGPTAHGAPGTQLNPGPCTFRAPHTPDPVTATPPSPFWGSGTAACGTWWPRRCGHGWHHGPMCVPGQCLHAALPNRQPGA